MQLYINNKGAWEVKNAFFVFFFNNNGATNCRCVKNIFKKSIIIKRFFISQKMDL